MHSDPIADMLTRIRNALMAGHPSVAIPHSKVKVAIAKILLQEGYIEDVSVGDEQPVKMIHITLKYWGARRTRRPVITKIDRVSKPGRRVYVGKGDIPWILSGMGIAIMTTPQGVMTGQQARRQGFGGEVLCYVY
ncbi:MAG: 30S ribosomal protein S8 [Anaerolineae bacterium]|nr:30S ribosomal protein S8 [Anaerolineae bacterium]